MSQTDSGGLVASEQAPSSATTRLTRVPGGRRNAVKVLLTDVEKEQITARARVVGVSVQRLMVESALAGSAQTVSERRALVAEFAGAIRLLGAVSNNVNQLARAYNASGQVPAELSATLHAAARVITRLDAAVEQLGGRR